MKLYELLSEAPKRDQYSPKGFFNDANAKKIVLARGKKVAQFIKKECAPWFKESKKGQYKFYRGFLKGANEVAFTKKTRTNREPKDSGKQEHEAFNALIKLGGGKANRSNAVFASSDQYVAEEYGQVFVVIPVGEYDYTWHTYYDDWTGMVPWGELLTLKPEKETKSKKSKLELEYEKKKKEKEKKLADFRGLLKTVFTDNGMKAPVPSVWYDIADDIDYMLMSREGTFAAHSSVKFKNVKKGKPIEARNGYYRKTTWRKLWVDFYNFLATLTPAKRATFVTPLRKIMRTANDAVSALRWLKMYKGFETFEKSNSGMGAYGSGGAKKNTWNPSKHKPSQLDKENKDLKKFLKGLRFDNLAGARQSGNEIMIKSKTVLGIDEAFYQKVVLPLLNGKQPNIADSEAVKLLYPAKADDDGW